MNEPVKPIVNPIAPQIRVFKSSGTSQLTQQQRQLIAAAQAADQLPAQAASAHAAALQAKIDIDEKARRNDIRSRAKATVQNHIVKSETTTPVKTTVVEANTRKFRRL